MSPNFIPGHLKHYKLFVVFYRKFTDNWRRLHIMQLGLEFKAKTLDAKAKKISSLASA